MSKAIVAQVTLPSNQVIDGLMLPDGTFAIAVPQVSELFQFANMHASRDIKALLGESFQFAKSYSELNSKAVNILSLADFEKLAAKLAFSVIRGIE